MLTPRELLQAKRAKRHGIVNPLIARREAKKAGLEFAVLCAVLMKETSGGHNVFGHDPAPARGWGIVTRSKYLTYVKLFNERHVAQGVGPMQLTYRGYQLRADRHGGCWNVEPNIAVGAGILADNIRRATGTKDGRIWTALRNYNGASVYADSVMAGVRFWRSIL